VDASDPDEDTPRNVQAELMERHAARAAEAHQPA
jgi:hypothetical protein